VRGSEKIGMPELTQFMVLSGVPRELIGLILMLPIVATIIAFSREVIGIKGFGVYTPLIIGFAFVETGLINGIIIFAVVLASGTLMRILIKHLRLLYLPRMAMVLSAVAFTIFLMFLAAAFLRETQFLKISLFPIIIIVSLVEKFIAAQIERGPRTAITLTAETLALASSSYLVITWGWLTRLILDWPLGVFAAALVVNIVLGKWTGLRITELIRFKGLMKHLEASARR